MQKNKANNICHFDEKHNRLTALKSNSKSTDLVIITNTKINVIFYTAN